MRHARLPAMGRDVLGEDAQMMDVPRFLKLAVHVKLASEAMIATARNLVVLQPNDPTAGDALAWVRAVDGLSAMNLELRSMERILRSATRATSKPCARRPRALASYPHYAPATYERQRARTYDHCRGGESNPYALAGGGF